ncbi:MAG: hypothetical protein HY293_07050 [Planctomycetes bacterium]|nr:hypothetical protein [Planctomycetota bacterium]
MAPKVTYSAFVAILVPCYWHLYGPTNFLYFCDMSLFFTLAAVWMESPLMASMPAVGILLPQALWMADFIATACGHPLTGLTAYMFDPAKPLFTRGLSFFHFWLPILLVYLIARLGYDRRALKAWSILAFGLLLICYFLLPGPPAPAGQHNLPVNVNFVYGLSDDGPQTWMDGRLYFLLEIVLLPTALYLPTHLILRKLFRSAAIPTTLERR